MIQLCSASFARTRGDSARAARQEGVERALLAVCKSSIPRGHRRASAFSSGCDRGGARKRRKPTQHVSLTEVAMMHRRASRMKKPDEAHRSLELLDEVLEACPGYVPALLLAGRRLQ